MTLNITVFTPANIVQISDRRMVDARTGRVIDDEANKALVLHCADGVLAVTFAGIGRVGNLRTDLWLAESLQDAGAAELDCRWACNHIAEAATGWFRTFPSGLDKRHTFVVAGWCDGKDRVVSRCWTISNLPHNMWTNSMETLDQFLVRPVTTSSRVGSVFVTGLLDSLNRRERKRLFTSLKQRTTIEAIESWGVEAIRRASADPASHGGIGEKCTAIALSPAREVRSLYYGTDGVPATYGPNLLWYYGGSNWLVTDIGSLPDGNFALGFGGGPTPVKLVVSSIDRWAVPSPLPAIQTIAWKHRITDARHRNEDKMESAPLLILMPRNSTQ